jgi:polar amino acid transport system substrate-binding protein
VLSSLILRLLLCSLWTGTGVGSAQASTGELRWAADAKAGAPYMFVDPENPKQYRGFEYDILSELAGRMGRKLVFVQNEWDSLIPGLERGDYDVAANGIEITPERAREVAFSRPYYATFEQLIVRAGDPTITALADVGTKKIGTLRASLAHAILQKQTRAQVVFYEEESSGYADVERGRIDGFFIDYPIALYYAVPNPSLRVAGPPVGSMLYGIAVSFKNQTLLEEINTQLDGMKKDGAINRILSKWNLLHPHTTEALGLPDRLKNDPSEMEKVIGQKTRILTFRERMARYLDLLPLLLKGAWRSLEISVVAMGVAILFGLLLAILRLYGNLAWSKMAQITIELIRGTPLLIQLYLIFFGLPHLGIQFSPFWAAVLGLGLNYGAYEAENYRAGIEAVPKSQIEAAHALALNPVQRFVHVIFPQAYRIILPPMTNDFISLIKDSSLVSVITMVELTTVYSQLASTYFDHLGLGVLVAALYFIIGYPFVRLARHLEKNLKRKLA